MLPKQLCGCFDLGMWPAFQQMLTALGNTLTIVIYEDIESDERVAVLELLVIVVQMLSYGCTRLEIGLQSIFEDVARDTNRGHTVAAVGDCFHLAKNAGFKVIAHLMPDLPNMGWERDMESFREFFENPDFRTDGLKVSASPKAVVMRTTPLANGACNHGVPCVQYERMLVEHVGMVVTA